MFAPDRICGVVAARDARGMAQQYRQALRYTSTVELRLDWLSNEREALKFLGWLRTHLPHSRSATLIATCRPRKFGGRFSGSMAAQLALLKLAAQFCAWADVEVETVERLRPGALRKLLAPARCLVSFHGFRRTPKRLGTTLARLERVGGDAHKVATLAHSLEDTQRLLALARRRRSVVVVPMGEIGLPGRVLALRQGSALAYASVENSTAPGQVPLDDMKHLYRADQLSRRTRVYGVIGDPIQHSLSPQLQNAGFQARRIDAVYLPFRVSALRDFLHAIGPLGIAGFSVTLPHKERIVDFLDGCDPLAAAIGAVNTVVVRAGGKLVGYNTDYVGVLRALERRMPLLGSRVLLFGAGGAARAVAFALAQAGSAVCVCARRASRAAALARAVRGHAIPRPHLQREFFDAIVNATPVGMHPRAGRSALAAHELNCRVVFDLIYRPRATRLLQLAARRGIETVSGFEMFVSQGTAQWEIWTGERAPVEIMRRAALRVLRQEERAQGIE